MGGKILIVDDEKDMLTLLKRIIAEDTEYAVTTETSSLKALDRFKNQAFDMVITDLKMPKMDGIDLLRDLRGCHRPLAARRRCDDAGRRRDPRRLSHADPARPVDLPGHPARNVRRAGARGGADPAVARNPVRRPGRRGSAVRRGADAAARGPRLGGRPRSSRTSCRLPPAPSTRSRIRARSSRTRTAVPPSSRASIAPGQTCDPAPKARCRRGSGPEPATRIGDLGELRFTAFRPVCLILLP